MAAQTYTAPGIGTFEYDPDSGIALPKGATQVSSNSSAAAQAASNQVANSSNSSTQNSGDYTGTYGKTYSQPTASTYNPDTGTTGTTGSSKVPTISPQSITNDWPGTSGQPHNQPTANTYNPSSLPATGAGMSGLGSMYKLVPGTNMYSENPDNPNAERFYADGTPVPSIGYDNQQTGQHFSGFGTPQEFQQLMGSVNNPAAESNLISNWLKSGELNSNYGMPVTPTPTTASASAYSSGGSMASQLTQAAQNPITSDGSLGLSVNGQTQQNVQVKNGQSYDSAQAVANDLGLGNPTVDQSTGMVTIGGKQFKPIGYDSSGSPMISYRDVAQTLGYGISYDDKSKSITITKPTSQQSTTTDVNDPNFLNQDPQTRLNTFAQNPNLAQQEMQRVQNVFNDLKTQLTSATLSGDNAKVQEIVNHMNAAQAWANQVTQVSGIGYANTPNLPSNQGTAQGTGTVTNVNGNPVPVGLLGNIPSNENGVFGFGGNQPTGGLTTGNGNYVDPTASINSQLSGMNLQQANMMPIQSQFNPDWKGYYDQAHAQIDPLYQSKYNDLISKQNGDISAMDQKMNARGIFTSGIAQAAEDDLRAKTTNSVATLFTKQMSDIEKTASSLAQTAYKQYSDGNQFALKYNQDQINNYLNQQKQIFGQWLQTQKLNLSQAQYALNAWDKQATMIWNQYKFSNLSADQQANLDFKNTQFNNLSADQQANLDQSWNKAILPYTNLTQYQSGQLAQGQQKIDLQTAAQQLQAYFKQMGINLDTEKLQEAIRHDQATESLASQRLTVDMANNQSNFAEKVRMDNANIDKANVQIQDTAKRTQLDGLKSELNSTAQRINSFVSNNQQVPQTLVDNYNQIKGSIESVIGSAGLTTDTGTSDGNFDANNQF